MDMPNILLDFLIVYLAILIFFARKNTNKVFFISIMMPFFGIAFNNVFTDFITSTFFDKSYFNIVYIIFFLLTFIFVHIIALEVDWKMWR